MLLGATGFSRATDDETGNRTILDIDFPGDREGVEVGCVNNEYKTFVEDLADTSSVGSEFCWNWMDGDFNRETAVRKSYPNVFLSDAISFCREAFFS